jgi:hypothetical protein
MKEVFSGVLVAEVDLHFRSENFSKLFAKSKLGLEVQEMDFGQLSFLTLMADSTQQAHYQRLALHQLSHFQ